VCEKSCTGHAGEKAGHDMRRNSKQRDPQSRKPFSVWLHNAPSQCEQLSMWHLKVKRRDRRPGHTKVKVRAPEDKQPSDTMPRPENGR